MGLANLVPGVSGGTMLLASGVYRRFIDSVARITRLQWTFDAILTLVVICTGAGLAVLFGAGVIKGLVHEHRWIMFSLFLGLTLGGVPLLWSMIKPCTSSAWFGCLVGLSCMVALALVGPADPSAMPDAGTWWILIFAGAAAASAMVLPGLSGSFVLLILGQYLVVLGAVEAAMFAVRGDGNLSEPMGVIIPVGIGAVIGVVVVSNAVKWALEHARSATLGFLLGLLLGSVLSLWPFRAPRAPEVGDVIRGQVVSEATRENIKLEHWPTESFSPDAGQWAVALTLLLVGFACAVGIGLIGGQEDDAHSDDTREDHSPSAGCT